MRADLKASASLSANRPKTERRSAARVATLLRGALVNGPAGKELCLVSNISPQGATVHGRPGQLVGDRVTVDLNDGTQLAGTVVWSSAGDFGLRLGEPADLAALVDDPADLAAWQQPRLPRIELGRSAMLRVGSRLHHATVVDISQGARSSSSAGP